TLLAHEFSVIGTVTTGAQLVEAEAALHPDVLVVDISMPGMSGLEATGQIRRRGSRVAVVYLSAHAEDDIVDAAWQAGALGYVTKPSPVRRPGPGTPPGRGGPRFGVVSAAPCSAPHQPPTPAGPGSCQFCRAPLQLLSVPPVPSTPYRNRHHQGGQHES